MGVVLNRPSAVDRSATPCRSSTSAVDGDEPRVRRRPRAARARSCCLAEFLDPEPAELLVLGRIGFPAPDADIDELAEATARGRVFAGYAGWGEGQLDAELEQGDWIAQAPPSRRTSSARSPRSCGARCSRARAAATR